jgi:hypothetical protein
MVIGALACSPKVVPRYRIVEIGEGGDKATDDDARLLLG